MPTWKDRAACRDHDLEFFFPDTRNPRDVDAAKAVCATCPVRDVCRDYAIRNGEEHGVWSGLDERELRAIKKARTKKKLPKMSHGRFDVAEMLRLAEQGLSCKEIAERLGVSDRSVYRRLKEAREAQTTDAPIAA